MAETTAVLRSDAMEFFKAAIASVDAGEVIRRSVKFDNDELVITGMNCPEIRFSIREFEKVHIIGAGKASSQMAQALEEILGEHLNGGTVVTKYGFAADCERISIIEAGHPLPDENSVRGAEQIRQLAEQADAHTLFFNLLSGGGSALMALPAEGVSLEEKIETTQLLLNCGAAIHEINCLRKHLSGIKGGQLAAMAAPGHVISLILSDVVGDKLDTIASGPTSPDTTTFGDAMAIVAKYGLADKLPERVRDLLVKGSSGFLADTPARNSEVFDTVRNVIAGSNRLALETIRHLAREKGYRVIRMGDDLQGEASEVGRNLVSEALSLQQKHPGEKLCLLAGGETTVTIKGDGKGGRNQELALAAATALEGHDNILLLSGGTDGNDGPTDAAGGVVDGNTLKKGSEQELEASAYLARNDAYHFLEAVDGLVKTGPTGTNVMDVMMALCG